MSETKEYIVSLNRGVDYDQFWNEIENLSADDGFVPSRRVDIVNNRDGSLRQCHYALTDDEAATLKNDSRVYDVEIPPEQRDDIVLVRRATQTGDFSKTTSDSGSYVNWGLRRMIAESNPYSGDTVTGGYTYTLDGAGADVVIHDSGIQADHPEFQDRQGATRVQQINWYDESGIAGTMPTAHYTDYDGHGTHVAGIAAGKTYGWAKGARIYSVKVNGLEGDADPNGGISITDCFDVVKLWHANKPVDPTTGVKRPTIINMSWGYNAYYTTVSSMNYRGVTKTGTDIDSGAKRWAFGLVPLTDGSIYTTNTRVSTVDVDIQELIDAGVHVIIAAGNNYHKIDLATGADYDNYAVTNSGTIYYNRGSSPLDDQAIKVGNIDTALNGASEQKAQSSETGPGVDIWAPGTSIMSSTSNVNQWGSGSQNYYLNSSFKQTNIGGTSMAAPQVAGLGALYLQLEPATTPAELKAWLRSNSKENLIYTSGLDNDYTNQRSLMGSDNKFAFNPFNSAVQLRITSSSNEVVATYALSTSSASVNEGSSLTITLTTTNVANGTTVPYTITGVNSADIGGASLTGNFIVNNNSATVTFAITADATTEGAETFLMTLNSLGVTLSVTVNDTSTTPSPTYSVTPAANNVNEGSAVTINVATTNVNNGTTLYWTVTNTGDFITSSGSFTVNSNAGSFTVTPAADATTEGAETFTASVRTGSISGTVVATTSNITINDTSVTPAGTVYNVTVASGTNEYGAGNKYYIDGFGGPSPTLNLIEGETYVFRQSDSSNATHPLRFSTTADGTWGSGVEYTDGVTIVGTAGQLGAYTQITVPVDAPTLYYYCVNHSGMGGTANTPSAATPTYDNVTSPASANEGSVVTFTVNTQNVTNGTTVGYTITGITAEDLSSGSLTGNITITSNTGTVSVTLANDLTTEGTETMTLTLAATDSVGTNTGALSSATTVNDTSTTPSPTYTITPAASSVNEGSSLEFTVGGTNILDGNYYWTVTNSSDFSTSSGVFPIGSNTGTFTVTPDADTTTEGAETFTASVRTGSVSGTIVATSSSVTINDTSTTPVFVPDYTINVVNSGSSAYTLSGSDRNGSISGNNSALAFNNGDKVSFVVNASGHPFWLKTAATTGTGSGISSGVTNNGTQSGTVQWTVGSTGTFYYICQFHGSMVGTITIS
jgi:subtilisin family serine protease